MFSRSNRVRAVLVIAMGVAALLSTPAVSSAVVPSINGNCMYCGIACNEGTETFCQEAGCGTGLPTCDETGCTDIHWHFWAVSLDCGGGT
jgi:hypothetical protein